MREEEGGRESEKRRGRRGSVREMEYRGLEGFFFSPSRGRQ